MCARELSIYFLFVRPFRNITGVQEVSYKCAFPHQLLSLQRTDLSFDKTVKRNHSQYTRLTDAQAFFILGWKDGFTSKQRLSTVHNYTAQKSQMSKRRKTSFSEKSARLAKNCPPLTVRLSYRLRPMLSLNLILYSLSTRKLCVFQSWIMVQHMTNT